MSASNRFKALLQLIDVLIEKHPTTSLKDLQELRASLLDAERRGKPLEAAKIALRVSVIVKFIYDHWPSDWPTP